MVYHPPVQQTRLFSSTPPWVSLLWWVDRWRRTIFVLIGIVYLAGSNGRWRITGDSAWYVLRARGEGGLAESVAVGATPPGLPAVIAAVGGEPGWVTALMMLAFAGAALALTYRLFLAHGDRPTAVLMTLLVALSGLFYETSTKLLTELPFMGGLLLLLWGHERRLKRKDGLWLGLAMMGAGVLWMAAFRSVVAVVVGAYLLAEAIRVVARRDQRRLGLTLVGVGLGGAAGLWAVSAAVRDDVIIFWNALRSKTLGAWGYNIQDLMTEALPEAVFGLDLPPVLAWPTSVMAVVGVLLLVRVRLLWGVLAGVMLVQWVVFIPDARYVMPVLPLVWYGVWRCAVGVLVRCNERWWGPGFVVGAVVLVGANAGAVIKTLAEQRAGDFYDTYRSGKYAAAVELSEVVQRETWPQTSLVVDVENMDAEFAALTRRRVLSAPAEPLAGVVWIGPAERAESLGIAGRVLGRSIDRRSDGMWEAWWIDEPEGR